MNRMIDVTTTDPITLEVVRNKVDGIANEMQSTLLRSSFSTVVKEGLDASASLFTPNGETLAQAIAIPIHLATLIPIVETIARTFPMDEMKPGDLYIMNDPYLGGTHLPDIAIVMPVFFDERPIAFSAAMTHHQDVGGMSPGSVPPNATEIYQEGIRIPPLKLREGNEFNHTLVEMLKLNVRVPQVFMGDIGAQISACTVGARRVAELAGRYYQADLHPETRIGDANFFDHTHRGITTGQTGIIGSGCVIYPCTLGGLSENVHKLHPSKGNYAQIIPDVGIF